MATGGSTSRISLRCSTRSDRKNSGIFFLLSRAGLVRVQHCSFFQQYPATAGLPGRRSRWQRVDKGRLPAKPDPSGGQGESGPATGSDCPFRRKVRHSFAKNRHSIRKTASNPRRQSRARYSTVPAEDRPENGFWDGRAGTPCFLDLSGSGRSRGCQGISAEIPVIPRGTDSSR